MESVTDAWAVAESGLDTPQEPPQQSGQEGCSRGRGWHWNRSVTEVGPAGADLHRQCIIRRRVHVY